MKNILGRSVATNFDGTIVAVSKKNGYVHVFTKKEDKWVLNSVINHEYGCTHSISLSSDGLSIVMCIFKDYDNNTTDGCIVSYSRKELNEEWKLISIRKVIEASAILKFGWDISLSKNGLTLYVGSTSKKGVNFIDIYSRPTIFSHWEIEDGINIDNICE